MRDLCVYLDAGHGGMVPGSKQYVTAPDKMWEHDSGEFHYNGFFYEGVFNRVITNKVQDMLKQLGIMSIQVSHSYLDTPLSDRTDLANWLYRYKKGVYISSHANAFNTEVRGFEVFCYPGSEKGAELADNMWENVNRILPTEFTMRTGNGTLHKEEDYHVLRETVMPSILIEHGFFDNYQDAQMLMKEEILNKFAWAQVMTILQWIKANTETTLLDRLKGLFKN